MAKADRKAASKIKDFLLYCLIGVLVAATAMLVGLYQARAGLSPESSIKWIGFAGMTMFAFGYVIRHFRRFWAQPKFWWLLAAFLVLHLALGFLIVPKLTDARLIHFAVATPFEYFALTACLNRLLNRQE
jgi:energy-converting hydrogenase Eha subunit G